MSACDDCIYTYPDCPTGEIDKKFDEVHGDNFNVVSCVNYVNNDGSYYDGHWHCHRCGKIIRVAGLCYECEKWLMDNPIDESFDEIDFVSDKITIPVKLKVTKISKHQSDFSDLDDSWESVSKPTICN